MVWTPTNPTNKKELLIYRYLLKSTDQPEFAKRFIHFIQLHDFLIENKYRYHKAEDIQKDVPFLSLEDCEKILDLLSVRGGSQYPAIDNVVRAVIDWMYTWTPGAVGNIAAKSIIQIRHFSDVFVPSEFRELYDLTLKLVTIMIREQIIASQSIPKESGFFNSIAQFIVTTVISMFTVLLNILNITDDDIGATFVDSFLILPEIGLLVYKLAQQIEPKLEDLSVRRRTLITLVKEQYGDQPANELEDLLPDPMNKNLEQYKFPDMERLMRAREILLDFLKNPDNELKLKQQISALAAQIKPTALEEHQKQLTEIASKYPPPVPPPVPAPAPVPAPVPPPVPAPASTGGKRLTRGHPLKKKWGTLRKLKQ